MASIRFSVKPLSNGTMAIRAMFQDGQQILYRNLGYSIPSSKVKGEYKHWDKSNYKVKGSLDNQFRINERIAKWTSLFERYKDDCKRDNLPVDVPAFIALLEAGGDSLPKPTDKTLLVNAAQEYHDNLAKTRGRGTTKQYKSMIAHLKEYEKKVRKAVRLADVNTDFYRDFGLWLIAEHHNINNTVNRQIGRIVTVMNYAVLQKYTTSIDYKHRYHFKSSPSGRFALWPDEVDQLWKHEFAGEKKLIRDAFVFACETTMRYSDIVQLVPAHLKAFRDGDLQLPVIDLTQVKTTNKNTFVLTDRALDIWQQYAIHRNKPVFPLQVSKEVNRQLKLILEKAKLNRPVEVVRTKGKEVKREMLPLSKVISFHMARNTAISTQLTYLPAPIVMANAGISKMDTVMGYNRNNDLSRYKMTADALNRKPQPEDSGQGTTTF